MEDLIIKIMVEMLAVPGAFLDWYITHHNRNIQQRNPHNRKLNKWEWLWMYKHEMQARELQTKLMKKDGVIDDRGRWIG